MLLTTHQQRDTPNYKLGALPGECGVNYHIDKKTEQNPDSWTCELFLLMGWDLALSCNNYYRQWIGRRGRDIEKIL